MGTFLSVLPVYDYMSNPLRFSSSNNGILSQNAHKTIRIASSTDTGVQYEFVVDGTVDTTSTSEVNTGSQRDSITEQSDGTILVTGVTGNPAGSIDEFRYTGRVLQFTFTSGSGVVQVDGSEVSPSAFPLDGGGEPSEPDNPDQPESGGSFWDMSGTEAIMYGSGAASFGSLVADRTDLTIPLGLISGGMYFVNKDNKGQSPPDSSTCSGDADCREGYVCQNGECVEDPNIEPTQRQIGFSLESLSTTAVNYEIVVNGEPSFVSGGRLGAEQGSDSITDLGNGRWLIEGSTGTASGSEPVYGDSFTWLATEPPEFGIEGFYTSDPSMTTVRINGSVVDHSSLPTR